MLKLKSAHNRARPSRRRGVLLTKTLRPVLVVAVLASAFNAYSSFVAPVKEFGNVVNIASNAQFTGSSPKSEDIRSEVKIAVVVPFHRCQALSRLRETLKFWDKQPPCVRPLAPETHLSLILYYSEDLDADPDINRKVRSLVRRLPRHARRCFDDIHFLSAVLSPTENIYPLGPCHQFYRAFPLLRRMRFSHWMLYEPDVIPIRAGWGDALLTLSSQNVNCHSWWQLGSWPMYRNKVDKLDLNNASGRDKHLNGNSVYCLLSPQFDDYRARVQMTFSTKGCAGPAEFSELAGYDHAMYRFRLLPENRAYMEDKLDRFVNDEFILNFGESGYDVMNVLRKYPSTMLVHGKYAFVTPDMRLHLDQKYATYNITSTLENMYLSELHRMPTRSELQFFTRAFQHLYGNEDVMRCILRELVSYCDHENHKSLYSWCGAQVQRVFERSSNAIITGLFIRFGQRMPGPEAATYVKLMNTGTQSCTSLVEKLCRLPKFSCPEIETLNLSSRKPLYPFYYDEMVYFFRKGIVKRLKTLSGRIAQTIRSNGAKHNCHSKDKVFSTTPLNHVMESSYLAVCKNASYNQITDTLSCMWDRKALSMSSPYECAEDINVNVLSGQLDC
mmetsp:Transcript_10612/g.41463  ORF Transcript_10612/g.41463 Transcript_10612/m.41463 type:complete len:614 (-) Transcript_10612:1389-3230(-)